MKIITKRGHSRYRCSIDSVNKRPLALADEQFLSPYLFIPLLPSQEDNNLPETVGCAQIPLLARNVDNNKVMRLMICRCNIFQCN